MGNIEYAENAAKEKVEKKITSTAKVSAELNISAATKKPQYSEEIGLGDIVVVNNNAGQTTLIYKGIVKYKPCQTGDSWVILDTHYQPFQPVYISEGVEIRLLEKKDGTKYKYVGYNVEESENLPF